MEEEPPTPPTPAQPTSPFWLPSTSTRPRHRFRPISALVFNTSFLVVLLSISAIAFLAILTPSLLSYTNHVFRPTSIKKGWDSLNLLLVVFAIVCGFIGRKDREEDRTAMDEGQGSKGTTTPRLVGSEQSYNWYPYGVQGNNVAQLRRNFSSYPDLRQEISWENDMRPRYFDDSYVGNCNSPRLVTSVESFRSQKVDDDQESDFDVKNLEVDGALGKHSSEDSIPPPVEIIPPSPPAEQPVSSLPPVPDLSNGAKDSKQGYQSVRRRGRRRKRLVAKEAQSPPPVRMRTPSPPPEVGQQESEEESARSAPKKRGGMTKEILSSIYHQSKRKKNQKRRSHENLEDFVHLPNPNPRARFAPPSPPPPPPPPPSIFHNIFSTKKGKSGKKSSSAPPPPPPPPPQRRSSASHSIPNSTKTKTRFTPKPTTNRTNLHLIDQIAGDGSESPLIPIPPPPPPPPFKFRSWKFAVEGDYVKIASSPKSGGGDSELEDSDASTPMATGNAQPAFSCPSPDVNHKADDFIAMFRAKLKLEKMDSIKQKKETGIGFSPLGPESSPSPT